MNTQLMQSGLADKLDMLYLGDDAQEKDKDKEKEEKIEGQTWNDINLLKPFFNI
jgi:hypothetical protein